MVHDRHDHHRRGRTRRLGSVFHRLPPNILCRRNLDLPDNRLADPAVPGAVLDGRSDVGCGVDAAGDGDHHGRDRTYRTAALPQRTGPAVYGIAGNGRVKSAEAPSEWLAV